MKSLPLPDLSDDTFSDEFYNAPDKAFAGHRDTMGVIEGLDSVLRHLHGLEIGFYETGSTDVLLTVLPYQEETVTLYRVEMIFDVKGEEEKHEVTVEADNALDAIVVANKVERKGMMTSVNVEGIEVPKSRVAEHLNG